MNKLLWKTKLAAWVHDPAEKALILLRDKTGHEWGTVADLRERLFGNRGKPSDTEKFVKRADHYAAAADRPQFPTLESDHRYAKWTQVDFAERPVLKHPLTGEEPDSLTGEGSDSDLGKLNDIPLDKLKAVSRSHFESLIHNNDEEGRPDFRKTLLAYWRFGPCTPSDAGLLNHLWQNLPADTRVPDHTIWSHLDTVSAFAGAMALDANDTASLLMVSFGPVQKFIAEARSTSDLWAGSHFLARIAWQGMRVVAEQLGPDAIMFPNLRGVPLVDVWLRDDMGLKKELFKDLGWYKAHSDANELFNAVFPNRFVAIVPTDQAQDLARQIKQDVQEYVHSTGKKALDNILEIIGEKPDGQHCYAQLKEQLKDFPEVHWAAVPWSLAEGAQEKADGRKLREVLSDFYPSEGKVGFLDSSAWKLLSRDLPVDGTRFYQPNPGTLYPAIYDLLDRLAQAAKGVRPFSQLPQQGYRSTLNGEREWLTLARNELDWPPGKRDNTLWARLAKQRPSLAKDGEHLDALSMIKRLWPSMFAEEVGKIINEDIRRYVVSTHTLALSVSLEQWLKNSYSLSDEQRLELEKMKEQAEQVALPRRLLKDIEQDTDEDLLCRYLPALYEQQDENEQKKWQKLFQKEPEAYYGVLLFDGDRMGAWISSSNDKFKIKFQESWHPQIRASVKNRFETNPDIKKYLDEKRPSSPARHRAISEALNGFSLKIARFVLEDCYKGKLIYAGGDDVMAFVCVDDLLPAMQLLNALYSGRDDIGNQDCKVNLKSGKGYVLLRNHLFPVMGTRATASCGAVVAHHKTPLQLVMRELRAAEQRAKKEGGRNAFSLKILKRAGGAIDVTKKWYWNGGQDGTEQSVPSLIQQLIEMLAHDTSRRAAYHSASWLRQLPEKPNPDMLKTALAHQFSRQTRAGRDADHGKLVRDLVDLVKDSDNYRDDLEKLLMVSEFLARESRYGEEE